MIAERRRHWRFSALAFAASIAVVAAGLGPVSTSFDQAAGGGAAWVGFAAFMTALAVPVFGRRSTVTTRIAHTVADGGDIPVWYRSVSDWVLLMLVGYVALPVSGWLPTGSPSYRPAQLVRLDPHRARDGLHRLVRHRERHLRSSRISAPTPSPYCS
ncbi:MAG TPA: hypothetical protein VF148_04845 [Acidimicrobiia bacterium]